MTVNIASIVSVSLLGVCCYQAATGAPCWTWENTCGDLPLCSVEPPGHAVKSTCYHEYCDNAQTCPWDGSKKRMMRTERDKYVWTDGQSFFACVEGPTTTALPYCCLCSNPGVLYEE
jgi:hypothetical protein